MLKLNPVATAVASLFALSALCMSAQAQLVATPDSMPAAAPADATPAGVAVAASQRVNVIAYLSDAPLAVALTKARAAGAGAVVGWNDFSGLSIFDNIGYTINARIPEPGALALSLAALGLLAGFSRRRQATLA